MAYVMQNPVEWMIGERAVEQRRARTEELDRLLNLKIYGIKPLQELNSILLHEILCKTLERNRSSSTPSSPSIESCVFSLSFQNLSPLSRNLNSAFQRLWVDAWLLKISDGFLSSMNEEAPLERELQCRSVLSAIILLRFHGVDQLQRDQYDTLRNKLNSRFEDLHFQRKIPSGLSSERFHKFQSSYLLHVIDQSVLSFERAMPRSAIILGKVMTSIYLGARIAGPLAAGSGIGDPRPIIPEIREILQPLSQSPAAKSRAFIRLLELTHLTVALGNLVDADKSAQTTSDYKKEASEILINLANSALAVILNEIERNRKFADETTPPSDIADRLQAGIGFQNPKLKNFYFFYGLLDCAAQITRSTKIQFPPVLTEIFQKTAVRAQVAAFRWKALECLICAAQNLNKLRISLLEEVTKETQSRLQNELVSISKIFSNKDDTNIESDNKNQLSPPIRPTERDCIEHGWLQKIEDGLQSPEINNECRQYKLPRLAASESYISTGLSPDCNVAYGLTKNSISLFSLLDLDSLDNRILKVHPSKQSEKFKECMMSARYIAIISDTRLYVIPCVESSGDERLHVTKDLLSDGHMWTPRCVGICDVGDDTLIAVGGEEFSNGYFTVAKIFAVRTDETGKTHITKRGTYPSRYGIIDVINFSPLGDYVLGLTKSNLVLIWSHLENPNNAAPFIICRKYAKDPNAQGITSIIPFAAESGAYVLCTTWPSSERYRNYGEWSFISPIGLHSQQEVNLTYKRDPLAYDIIDTGKYGNIIAGAASPIANYIALMTHKGEIMVFPLRPVKDGGISSFQTKPGTKTVLKLKLAKKDKIAQPRKASHSSSLKFRKTETGLELFAIDYKGDIIYKEI